MRILPYFPPALFLLGGFVLSCNGDNVAVPTTGFLEVTTITTGVELDPDGYTVRLDAQPPMGIGPADTIEDIELSPGNYSLLLEGFADNCQVEDENPRNIRIRAGETTSVTLEVTCSPTQGQVRVP